MSGFKHMVVSINPEEVRNLIRLPKIRCNSLKEKETEKAEERIDEKILEDIKARQNDYEEMMGSFSSELQVIERDNQKILREHQETMFQQLEHIRTDLWRLSQDNILENSQKIIRDFREENRNMKNEIESTQHMLLDLAQKQEKDSAPVLEWLQAAGDVYYFIRDNYGELPELSADLQRLENMLFLAAQNQADGLDEAALMGAQQVFGELIQIRLQCEQNENERIIKYRQALSLIAWIHQAANEQRTCAAVDMEGQELAYQIDVDYWSKRKLSRLLETSDRLLENLEENYHNWQAPALDNLLEVTLPGYIHELEDILRKARLAALNSQLRLNIADVVVQAMERQGFKLLDSNYARQDMRMDYQAQMKNIDGSLMNILISPLSGEPMDNDIQIEALDPEQRTRHEILQRVKEIRQALARFGLQVGEISSHSSIPCAQGSHELSFSRKLQQVNGYKERRNSLELEGLK